MVELAAGGGTNREIAQTLFVTEKTVETHLGRAFRKLNVLVEATAARRARQRRRASLRRRSLMMTACCSWLLGMTRDGWNGLIRVGCSEREWMR